MWSREPAARSDEIAARTWGCAKRLERGPFNRPKNGVDDPAVLRILSSELTLLLNGIDLEKTRERKWWRKAAQEKVTFFQIHPGAGF